MVEACALLQARESLPVGGKLVKFGRLYLGSEFCECKLPTTDELERIFDLGKKISIVTPMVGRAGMAYLRRILDRLDEWGHECEIVANDFGVLEMVRERTGLTPVLGRLLARNVFDLDKGRLIVPSLEPFELLGNTYGVSRYEITNYRYKIRPAEGAMPPGVHLTLHYPYMYVATTRQCLFRFRNTGYCERIEHIECDISCKDHMFRFEYPGVIEEPLYLKGNTLFVCFDDMSYTEKELARLGVDRIVFSPNLPV